MKAFFLALLFTLLGPNSRAQHSSHHYDIQITVLHNQEMLLLNELNSPDLKYQSIRKYEIEQQLQEIRRQKLEIERIRAGLTDPWDSGQPVSPAHPSSLYTPLQPTTPDWTQVESPTVIVKGIATIGNQRGALVSGGKIVFSNEVFATTYKSKTYYWRVTSIGEASANFIEVDNRGVPIKEDEKKTKEPKKRGWWWW